MGIVIIGINHKTSPIEIREKFYCNEVEQELLLSELKSSCCVVEALILSTCNRTEIFANLLDLDRDTEFLFKTLFQLKKVKPAKALKNRFYILKEEQAIRHLFEVSAGLDSLVLGERQILGQVKHATRLSREKGMLGKSFNILTNLAIRSGKKAQHETEICCGGMSVSWAAVTMAEEMLGTLKDKVVLIMGAGKMGELAGDILKERNPKKIYVMNRTRENAVALAEKFDAIPVGYDDVKEVLAETDLGICAVDAPHYILDCDTVKRVLPSRKERKLHLVDISTPRNIDPEIHKLPDVSLVDIDNLDKVVGANRARRETAIDPVTKIVHAKIKDFYKKINKIEELRVAGELVAAK